MIVVIFELEAGPGREDSYFELAATLQSSLKHIDGFIAVERYEHVARPGHYLSLSTWRDEAAVHAWRNQMEHREAQSQGRSDILKSYRLRVASVIRDYGLSDRTQAPEDSRAEHG